MTEQQKRINKLRKLLKSENEALIVSSNANVYYFTGFNNSEGTLVVTKRKSYFYVDFRYFESAKKIVSSSEVMLSTSLVDDLVSLLSDEHIKSVFIETKTTTLYSYRNLQKNFQKANISITTVSTLDTYIENQRMIKSTSEIELMEIAQNITEKAFNEILPLIVPGATEKEIKNELEYRMKKNGAEDVSFDLITITGKKTSLPHGVPSNEKIKKGDFFTMDIGALYKGYHSDMTRTVSVGTPSDEQKNIYDIVYNAQTTALETVKAGVACSLVDKTARDIIYGAGFDKCFGHSTGHGVGLDIHEKPNLSPSGDTILSSGMVVTVEPGIYIENKFGVRIEDMVLVTDNGYRNFAHLEKKLIIL